MRGNDVTQDTGALRCSHGGIDRKARIMGMNPKDALESAKDIAKNAVDKSGDIVEGAGEALKGDVSGGVNKIVKSATDIATDSVEKAKEMFTGKDDAGA